MEQVKEVFEESQTEIPPSDQTDTEASVTQIISKNYFDDIINEQQSITEKTESTAGGYSSSQNVWNFVFI